MYGCGFDYDTWAVFRREADAMWMAVHGFGWTGWCVGVVICGGDGGGEVGRVYSLRIILMHGRSWGGGGRVLALVVVAVVEVVVALVVVLVVVLALA